MSILIVRALSKLRTLKQLVVPDKVTQQDKWRNRQMSLFNEQEVLNENQHEQFDISALEIGESLPFYYANTRDATSEDYGDFIICQGIKVDIEAASIDALAGSAKPISFIPNTLLKNKIDEGSMIEGELYRIEKAWDKNQKFKDGKKAKGWGYKVFHLAADPKTKTALVNAYKTAVQPASLAEAEAEVSETPAKPGV